MKNLKKKIAVILFSKHFYNCQFLIIVPNAALRGSRFFYKFYSGVRYALLKGSTNSLLVFNTRYAIFHSKNMFMEYVRTFRESLVGIKIQNLYFFVSTLAAFNYLHLYNFKKFCFSFKALFYFMFNYMSIFFSKNL